jgi:hypothetical protein
MQLIMAKKNDISMVSYIVMVRSHHIDPRDSTNLQMNVFGPSSSRDIECEAIFDEMIHN